jgi:hypothetical protein
MTVAIALRTTAVALVVAGVVDPSWRVRRQTPVPVDLLVNREGQTSADVIRQRLTRDLDQHVEFNGAAAPKAVVVVGASVSADALPAEDVPVSTVAIERPTPAVTILAASDPGRVPVGLTTTLRATLRARGLKGTTSRIALEQDGVELTAVDHPWTADDERFDARLPYSPAVEGSSRVTWRVHSKDARPDHPPATADVRVAGTGQRLKVLSHEPRPSWAVTFVRRALEADALFDVSSRVRASKSAEVRAGHPPPTLTTDALNVFDVVMVGAPEELRSAEVDALRLFASRRGGTIVLLPDRRPSGAYLALLPVKRFDEVLIDGAVDLRAFEGPTLRASEFALPVQVAPGTDELAALDQGKGRRPAIVSWSVGAGTVVFAGALDAWRFRASADDGFGRFWRARMAEAALAAPRRVEVSVSPAIASATDSVMIRAELRQTELIEGAGHTRVPAVRATLIGAGREQVVRLWPTAEIGVFEGRVAALSKGQYDVQVTTDTGAVGDEVLTVVSGATHAKATDENGREALRTIAASTGGVAVEQSDLTSLERFLQSLPRGETTGAWRPTRSPWFAITVIGLLCAEWTLRRRRGKA